MHLIFVIGLPCEHIVTVKISQIMVSLKHTYRTDHSRLEEIILTLLPIILFVYSQKISLLFL